MTKALKDMTPEELWQLFPIELAPYNPEWKEWAQEETALLKNILSDYSPSITHIGSTAVPGILAKPIIDLLVEVSSAEFFPNLRSDLESTGYICMSASAARLSFNKGYTPHGYAPKVYHIHIRLSGDNDEICFRDYLNSHAEAAKEYETLKTRLAATYKYNRDAYTAAKTEFITKITTIAKAACQPAAE